MKIIKKPHKCFILNQERPETLQMFLILLFSETSEWTSRGLLANYSDKF